MRDFELIGDLTWEEVADGRVWRLRRGKHYIGDTQKVKGPARDAAERLGKAVRVTRDAMGSVHYVWVQFHDHQVALGEPCPCGNRSLIRIHKQFLRCPACGASLMVQGAVEGWAVALGDEGEDPEQDVSELPVAVDEPEASREEPAVFATGNGQSPELGTQPVESLLPAADEAEDELVAEPEHGHRPELADELADAAEEEPQAEDEPEPVAEDELRPQAEDEPEPEDEPERADEPEADPAAVDDEEPEEAAEEDAEGAKLGKPGRERAKGEPRPPKERPPREPKPPKVRAPREPPPPRPPRPPREPKVREPKVREPKEREPKVREPKVREPKEPRPPKPAGPTLEDYTEVDLEVYRRAPEKEVLYGHAVDDRGRRVLMIVVYPLDENGSRIDDPDRPGHQLHRVSSLPVEPFRAMVDLDAL